MVGDAGAARGKEEEPGKEKEPTQASVEDRQPAPPLSVPPPLYSSYSTRARTQRHRCERNLPCALWEVMGWKAGSRFPMATLSAS